MAQNWPRRFSLATILRWATPTSRRATTHAKPTSIPNPLSISHLSLITFGHPSLKRWYNTLTIKAAA